jgi:predicted ATPase
VTRSTFGRDEELAVLRQLIVDTVAGAGGCVLLSGPAGIGKSHVLHVAMDLAVDRGVCVAARAAFELDRAVPLVTLAGALQRCVPTTPAFAWLDDERDSSYLTLRRLAETMEEHAARRPLLVVIDDAQWMDELSALAIRELMPALRTSPVSWLFACRWTRSAPTPGSQMLERLAREWPLSSVTLKELDDDAVGHLCEQVVGAKVDQTVRALAAGCSGVPLQIEQLLRALMVTRQLVVLAARELRHDREAGAGRSVRGLPAPGPLRIGLRPPVQRRLPRTLDEPAAGGHHPDRGGGNVGADPGR